MTIHPPLLFLTTVSFITVSTSPVFAIDCSQISKEAGANVADSLAQVCQHFDGVDHQPYLDWLDSNDISNNYTNQVFIPGSDPDKPENGMAVHWRVDDEQVNLALATRATGWMGFGIGEAGGSYTKMIAAYVVKK